MHRGVPAVHYLIFSDNVMVRRAAMEALCNMNTHESVLKVGARIPTVLPWYVLVPERDVWLFPLRCCAAVTN